MMRRLAVLALTVLPLAAGAQTTVGPITFPAEDQFIGVVECNGSPDNPSISFTAQVVLSSGSFTGGEFRVKVSNDPECDQTDTTKDIRTQTLQEGIPATSTTLNYPRSGDPSSPLQYISPAPLLFTCTDTPGVIDDKTINVCVELTDATGGTVLGTARGSFKLQLDAPAAPGGVTVRASEEALEVGWSAVTGSPQVKDYRAQASPQGNPAEMHFSDWVTGTTARVEGLTNDVTYDVVVYARSKGDNESPASASVPGTPKAIDDFWEYYKANGGREEGGCASAGGAGALAALGLLALRARSRRRS